MATPIEILNRKRSNIKSSFTKIKTFVGNLTAITANLDDIRIRIKHTEQLFRDFIDVEERIFAINKEDQSQHGTLEEVYYDLLAKLSEWERHLTTRVGAGALDTSLNDTFGGQRNVSAEVKLPGLRIPKFNGDYTEWQTFYQLFTTTIHNNTSLHSVQKYQFLVNSLGDEPARLIKHMDITEANYILALNKLKERYDRKRHVVNKFIQMFLNQPVISKSTAKNLRQMYDISDEVIRALKGLGKEANDRDVWLMYVLVTKLDETTRTLWMQQSVESDFPSLESFLKFITNRAEALEYQVKVDDRPRNVTTVVSAKPHMKALTTVVDRCPVCKTGEHPIYRCPGFGEMTVEKRREFIKNERRCFNCFGRNHTVRECRSYKKCHHCQRRHHSLVHEPYYTIQSHPVAQENASVNTIAIETSDIAIPNNSATCSTKVHLAAVNPSTTISVLPTALVRILNRVGEWQICRALLDSGAEVSFITEDCVQKLGLSRSEAKINIQGLAHQNIGQTKGITQVKLKPHFTSEFETILSTYITPHITNTRAPATLNSAILKAMNGEKMADPSSHMVTRIDILIGIDYFWSLLSEGQLKHENKVIAQRSKLGWIMAGAFTTNQVASVMSVSCDANLERNLIKFWESEEIEKYEGKSVYNPCEEHFIQTHSRHEAGRFVVKLPFKDNQQQLGNSYETAKGRLLSMERKFARNPQYHQLYRSFINEYIDLNHMTVVPSSDKKFAVYLPHHGIFKESSTTTKLRVVFDASAPTSTGISLNTTLEVGPCIQRSLYHVLLHFRRGRIAFTADIEKMYRQILIHPDDRRYQRILWRNKIEDPIQVYELNTVTYGMAPSSFLATRVLYEIADSHQNQYPEAAQTIRDKMYMDDLMSGASTVVDAVRVSLEVDKMLKSAGLVLRKWRSNSKQFLELVSKDESSTQLPIDLDRTEAIKVLGLQWIPETDFFTYCIQLEAQPLFTKRKMLAEFSRIFDPLGLLSPFIIKIKIMFQQLWLLKLAWDEPLPRKMQQGWLNLRHEIPDIKTIRITRWLGSTNGKSTIHGFSDASEKAYAAVLYLCNDRDGVTTSQLITAKTKVAPVNTVSVARLELCGALLLAKLMDQVATVLEVSKESIIAWTDSSIVLDWLSDTPQRWKTYVANRTSKILNILPRRHWHHVPSELNPADCATRGLSPNELKNFHLWWHGPNYLLHSETEWPTFDRPKVKNQMEARKCLIISSSGRTGEVEFIYQLHERYSSFRKLVMVLAYINRVIDALTKRRIEDTNRLNRKEMIHSTMRVYQAVQTRHFAKEIHKLKTGQQIPRESKLVTLDPFIDESGILRVGGRIDKAPVSYDQRHPIVLPNHDPIVTKLITDQHINNFHCGPAYLLHLMRKNYWILGIRSTIRGIFRKCVQCIKQNPHVAAQKMGMLTKERLELVKPFMRTGVDFAGPIRTVLIHGRGQRVRKTYICVFVCMCTKALHIEIATDLSTEAFLAAFERFIARRGPCTDLYSDNGSNFRGAKRVIDDLNKFWSENGDQVAYQIMKKHQTNWHFIPVQAPHFGGLWEAGVKSIKSHLQRVTGETILSNDELYTLVVQIESMLNSRPLCTNGPELQDVLTPAHYLIGTQTVSLVYPDVTQIAYNRLSHWQAIQKMVQLMWRRWYGEYIHSLQQRFKWKYDGANLEVDQIVLIKDENPLLNNWRLGKVEKLHTGADGRVRLVTLKTADGEIQRVIHKLCPLPTQ